MNGKTGEGSEKQRSVEQQTVDLPCKGEIAFGQSAAGVRGQGEGDASVADINVGMMIGSFGRVR